MKTKTNKKYSPPSYVHIGFNESKTWESEMPFSPQRINIYLISIVYKVTCILLNVILTTILWGGYYYYQSEAQTNEMSCSSSCVWQMTGTVFKPNLPPEPKSTLFTLYCLQINQIWKQDQKNVIVSFIFLTSGRL